MRFLLFFTTALVLFCSQFVSTTARPHNQPARTSSLRPYSEGAILYRSQQLDPDFMRRSPPEEVLNDYARRQKAQQDLLNSLGGAGSVDLFRLTSGGRQGASTQYHYGRW